MGSTYWLTNVKLESGFHREGGFVTGTLTDLNDMLIENGRITKINPAGSSPDGALVRKDAHGSLALPGFIEKHCHLDKTLLGDAWQACRPARNRIEIFDHEKATLPGLTTSMEHRAGKLIEILLAAGSTHIRSHVDIYPEAGLDHLAAVRRALSAYKGRCSSEIVAFPQHGLLRSGARNLIKQALREGASIVGGVDPAVIDGDIETSLQQMMELAVGANAGIDIHLHDPGPLGVFTIKRLAALVEEAGWMGKVAISHAYCLGDVSVAEAGEVADRMAELDITLITSVPINRPMPPVGVMLEKGVRVALGCDNVFDLWSPFGNGDILERACRLAERFLWRDELSLSRALGFITAGKVPLDQSGNQVWPAPGDEADLVLVSASCSAEAVARRSKRQAVLHRGKLVSGCLGADD